MKLEKIISNAKINLSLSVLKKLKSKFHKIESLICFIDLHDEIYLNKLKNKRHKIIFYGKFAKGINKKNTISTLMQILDKKKLLNEDKYLIKIKKNIPHKSGLGGGSINAAKILKYFIKKYKLKLNHKEILKITSKIGSDTIIGVHKTPIIQLSDGEVKKTKFKKKLHLVLVKPNFGCSTKEIYSKVRNFSKTSHKLIKSRNLSHTFLSKLSNDLEIPAFKKNTKLNKIKSFMKDLNNILFARMTGSGSTMIAYFNSKKDAENAHKILKKKYKNYWCILSKTI